MRDCILGGDRPRLTANPLPTGPASPPPTPYTRRVPATARALSPDATARLMALPDALRAWARGDPVVQLYLGTHVTAGVPLGLALARRCDALGGGGDLALHRRLVAAEPTAGTGHWWPWCAHEHQGGLRCRALTRQLVHLVSGGAVEACDDCAVALVRSGVGRVLRALAPR